MEQRFRRAVVLLALLLQLMFAQVDASYRFYVRAHTYHNPDSEDWEGDCCDPSIFSSSCSDDCDNYFQFCLRPRGTNPTSSICFLGLFTSQGSSISDDSITFGSSIGNLNNPLVYVGNEWPGGYQLRVSVWDNDADANDLVDRIFAERNLAISQSYTAETSYTGIYNRGTITLSFKVECALFYYGSNCRTFCQPKDDATGHFSCDDNGNKVCLDGWLDVSTNCLTPAPICTEGCHEIGGYCEVDGECRCNPGWTGDLCDTCTPAIGCDHGTCTLPNECNCDQGYSGTLCKLDDDVCGHVAPCFTGATCTNQGPDEYLCTCPAGYTGGDCGTDIDECQSFPCQNLGVCTDLVNGFECECGTGWAGDTCEDNINECDSSPCLNGGTCMDCTPTGPTVVDPTSPDDSCPIGYHCTCTALHYGDNCEFEHNPCADNDCMNGARCVDISETVYRCECPPGYTGSLCETEVDECQPNPCLNNGTCTDGIGSYSCTCLTGFTGPHCEINIDECADNECSAASTISCVDGVATYRCRCHPGYTGRFCETDIDDCDPSPCLEGATCRDLVHDVECICPPGFTGPLCMENIDDCIHPALCLNNGVCMDEINDFSCNCLPGWTGRQCETESLSPCVPNPCPQGMACVERLGDLTNEFICEECHQGVAGCNTTNADTQGGSEKKSSSGLSGDTIGAIVGGAVAALVLLLLIIAVCLCCYLKGLCCCCCCGGDKDDETSYDVWQAGVSQNPVYMGPNTVMRNADGTLSKPDANSRSHQNPMYAISQLSSSISRPPLPPARTGSRELLLSTPPTTPKLAFDSNGHLDDTKHQYDTIPAYTMGASPPPPSDLARTSQRYQQPAFSAAPIMASGKYDRLEDRNSRLASQSAENPYVVDPSMPGVVLPGAMAQMGPDAGDEAGKELDVETIHLDMPASAKSPYDP